MSKRKREDSLAEQVLEKKLAILRNSKNDTSTKHKDRSAFNDKSAFSYLLEISLEVERLAPPRHSSVESRSPAKAAEEGGDYDYTVLQTEPLSSATNHASFLGPVKVSALPAPKAQGVTAIRDILKGELLCTSVPSIVVQNLAAVDDPSDLLFSDISRAEMTAKLILMAETSPKILATLESFEFAEKEGLVQGDLASLCEAIISKYTWAIDHPSINPKGRPFHGKYTKVAGHAFTVDGYAGKFNHSCVPNATMVSYGAVQFFRANVNIPRDTEICVSYGFDPLDTVEKRREKLLDHAGFECTCPLCLYQSQATTPTAKKAPNSTAFEDILHRVIFSNETWSTRIRNMSKERLATLSHDAILVTAKILDDDIHQEFLPLYKDANILQLLTTQARWQATLAEEEDTSSPGSLHTFIITHCILLCIMLISLTLPRSRDIGIVFGDFFRITIQTLAERISAYSSAQSNVLHHDDDDALEKDYFSAEWWMEKSLEYTDCF